LLIGDEGELPYNRTPLSKELWHTDDPKIAENLVYKQWDGKQRRLASFPVFFVAFLFLSERRISPNAASITSHRSHLSTFCLKRGPRK